MSGKSPTKRHMSKLRDLRAGDPKKVLTLETLGQAGPPQRKRIDVYHVNPTIDDLNQSRPPSDKEPKEPKNRSKPILMEDDTLGIRALLSDICRLNVYEIVEGSRCRGGNPLHSTATESDLPGPGTEDALIGNVIGSKDGISVTKRPNSSGIKYTRTAGKVF